MEDHLDVFRDLGLAFGAALLGIFVILMFQTGSRVLPLVIMLAIPLTMIGIMPGFWLLNAVIGCADRRLSQSRLLHRHGHDRHDRPGRDRGPQLRGADRLSSTWPRRKDLPLREAIIRSVAVRTRPILLTAGTTLLANWVITLDPVFSGLAWAIIFGILSSTVFTLVVIPVTYWLLYASTADAGLDPR